MNVLPINNNISKHESLAIDPQITMNIVGNHSN